jgi:hypothetical protein
LLRDAIREYVARHGQENITEATDRVCAEWGQPADEFVSAPRAASSKEANGDFVG